MISKIIASMAIGTALLVGCDYQPAPSPCTKLPPPTKQEQDIARSGVELERETGNVECVIVGDRWVEDEAE